MKNNIKTLRFADFTAWELPNYRQNAFEDMLGALSCISNIEASETIAENILKAIRFLNENERKIQIDYSKDLYYFSIKAKKNGYETVKPAKDQRAAQSFFANLVLEALPPYFKTF